MTLSASVSQRLPPSWVTVGLVPVLLLLACVTASAWLGTDAGWDLLNYHLYDPFAALFKAPGVDLVPAQIQSFFPPTADILPFLVRRALNAWPVTVCLLFALPEAAGCIAAWFIGLQLLPNEVASATRVAAVLLALAIGATGVAAAPLVGSSMSDIGEGWAVLGGLLLLLRDLNGTGHPVRQIGAGLLLGVAAALKLTAAPWVAAAGLSYLLFIRGGVAARLGAAGRVGGAGLVALTVLGGPWWLHLYRATGNPLLPFANAIFRSPLLPVENWSDTRYIPMGLWQTVSLPVRLALHPNRLTSEYEVQDPRLAVEVAAWLVWLGAVVLRGRASRATLCFGLFLALGLIAWERTSAILRYLAPFEMVGGFALLLAVAPLLPRRPAVGLGILAAALAGCAMLTVYPNWGRVPPVGCVVCLRDGELPQEGAVLLLTPDPMGYMATLAPPGVRFIGVNNNVVQPGAQTGIARAVADAVAGLPGPTWGLVGGDMSGGTVEQVLAAYSLSRDGEACHPVRSNIDGAMLQVCRLHRVAKG